MHSVHSLQKSFLSMTFVFSSNGILSVLQKLATIRFRLRKKLTRNTAQYICSFNQNLRRGSSRSTWLIRAQAMCSLRKNLRKGLHVLRGEELKLCVFVLFQNLRRVTSERLYVVNECYICVFSLSESEEGNFGLYVVKETGETRRIGEAEFPLLLRYRTQKTSNCFPLIELQQTDMST
jgi:hypothetical protein